METTDNDSCKADRWLRSYLRTWLRTHLSAARRLVVAANLNSWASGDGTSTLLINCKITLFHKIHKHQVWATHRNISQGGCEAVRLRGGAALCGLQQWAMSIMTNYHESEEFCWRGSAGIPHVGQSLLCDLNHQIKFTNRSKSRWIVLQTDPGYTLSK